MNKISQDLVKLNILYFQFRNTWSVGYQRYSHFRNTIRYVSNIYDYKTIRRIFQAMINKGCFKKITEGKVTKYWFNPYDKPLPVRKNIVYF